VVEALIEARVKVRKAAVAMGVTAKKGLVQKEALSLPVFSALKGLNTLLETKRPMDADEKVSTAVHETEKIAKQFTERVRLAAGNMQFGGGSKHKEVKSQLFEVKCHLQP